MLNRKAEQEWHWEKRKTMLRRMRLKLFMRRILGAPLLKSNFRQVISSGSSGEPSIRQLREGSSRRVSRPTSGWASAQPQPSLAQRSMRPARLTAPPSSSFANKPVAGRRKAAAPYAPSGLASPACANQRRRLLLRERA
jgi:hypothetical protein